MSEYRSFREALLDPGRSLPAGIRTWNGSDPEKRFAVYRNNVVSSLVTALADTFPVTQQLVGETFFRAMARLFVGSHPPWSPVLAFYGASLPAFVKRFPPAKSVPYLADVARLEWLRVRAYYAADDDTLSAEAVRPALTRASLTEVTVTLHAAVGLVQSPYAVVSIWGAHHGYGELATVDPGEPENALVTRAQLQVGVVSVKPADGTFVDQLLQGASLHRSAALARARDPSFDVLTTLGLLARHGAISALQRTDSTR